MNTTIRVHNVRATVAMALLAVLLVLAAAMVVARPPAPTTSDRNATHAMTADGKRVPSIP